MSDKNKTDHIDVDDSLKPLLLEVEKALVKSCLEKLRDDPEKLRAGHVKEIRMLLESYGILKKVDKPSTELEKIQESLPEFNFEFDPTLHGDNPEVDKESESKWDLMPLR